MLLAKCDYDTDITVQREKAGTLVTYNISGSVSVLSRTPLV